MDRMGLFIKEACNKAKDSSPCVVRLSDLAVRYNIRELNRG